jgi:hypothetical protein
VRWLVILVVLLGGCASPAPPSGTSEPVPFPTFLLEIKTARYADYAPPRSQVESEAAFEEMRRYLLDRYEHATVTRTYLDNGITFDCIAGNDSAAVGALCPAGSVPTRRTTLAEMTRFTDLQAFLGKAPGGGKVPPTPPPT